MKRIPLRCSSVPKVNCAGVDPPRNMNSQDAINPHGRSACQPPALSYVDGQMAGKHVQAPTVAISPTAPWTRADNGLGSQLPKPVKAAVKNDEDALMQEAVDPSLPKIVQKNHKESALKEPDDVEMGGQESGIPPISAKVVISQASPLKRISLPADDKTDVDIPDNLSKHGPSGELPGGEQGKPPSDDQGKKVLSVGLNGTFPPGKPVIPDQARAKNSSATTTGTRTRASSAPPKSSSGRSRKVGHAQSGGLLADAFRNAQAQKSSGPDGLSRPNTSPEGHTHAQAPIDLTSSKDDPIEEDVDPSLQLQVADALEKWYPELDKQSKREDMVLASTFLQCMNSTLCFLTVSFRMLSKAPWKSKMLTTHIRQAALAAIGNGWFVWSDKQHKVPFSRAELALAAVSYRGCLQPRMPDDPAQAIFPMIDYLPTNIGCEEMFSQGNCFCPLESLPCLPLLRQSHGSLLPGRLYKVPFRKLRLFRGGRVLRGTNPIAQETKSLSE